VFCPHLAEGSIVRKMRTFMTGYYGLRTGVDGRWRGRYRLLLRDWGAGDSPLGAPGNGRSCHGRSSLALSSRRARSRVPFKRRGDPLCEKAPAGVHHNEHLEGDGAAIFAHARRCGILKSLPGQNGARPPSNGACGSFISPDIQRFWRCNRPTRSTAPLPSVSFCLGRPSSGPFPRESKAAPATGRRERSTLSGVWADAVW
jgi:hypothetical protein